MTDNWSTVTFSMRTIRPIFIVAKTHFPFGTSSPRVTDEFNGHQINIIAQCNSGAGPVLDNYCLEQTHFIKIKTQTVILFQTIHNFVRFFDKK